MSSTSSTVCHQGMKSCLEPLVRLKLAPPRSNFPSTSCWDCKPDPQETEDISHIEKTITTTNNNLNLIDSKDADKPGLSFLQSLGNPKNQTTKTETETEKVYVHPLVKRSALMLSPKSLEMCTESLGSETGSENGGDDFSLFSQIDADISFLSLESSGKINPTCTPTITSESSKISSDNNVRASPKTLKRSVATSFPPPLTSISGSNGVQVRPHREGGRLVLKAVTVSSPPTAYFQAERGDGRLRLLLLKDPSPNCDIEEAGEDECEEEFPVEDDPAVEVEEDEVENQMEAENEAYDCEEENGFDVETEEMDWKSGNVKTEEMDGNAGNVVEADEMDGNSGNVAGEKGMGKLPRPSRCKEGRRGNKKMVMNWPESFWVAT
ncbi:hypothetical protein L3X38_045154 [Prunus dulcis]|uniref:FAF domain-containing protein n=1 Tax=Prunus dulcis TaxID=3755 RepID=A0AAD4V0B8_PRUDU|nr:hypothetical protein L3X38_045154 [Prunus dulcis]